MVQTEGKEGRDTHGLLARTPVHLSFTAEEEHQGRENVCKLGIPDGTLFVCFYARDPAYLGRFIPEADWRYHDYRNCSIHSFVPAAEELTRRGYFAIRMGAIVTETLRTTNARIIDYATNGSRTEFMDIYLGAKCRFFVSSGAGLDGIPMIFRRPIAYANFIPLEYVQSWAPNDLFIPKKLWLRTEHRFMTFKEILRSDVGRFTFLEQYQRLGVDLVENTSDEITALAVEMDERLNGTWLETEEDVELQRCFWSLFKSSTLHGVIRSRVGAEFLRQNRELLK